MMKKYNASRRIQTDCENALLLLFFHSISYSNYQPLMFLILLNTKTFLAVCYCFQTNLLIDDHKSLITSFTNLMKRRSLMFAAWSYYISCNILVHLNCPLWLGVVAQGRVMTRELMGLFRGGKKKFCYWGLWQDHLC